MRTDSSLKSILWAMKKSKKGKKIITVLDRRRTLDSMAELKYFWKTLKNTEMDTRDFSLKTNKMKRLRK